MQVTSLGKTRFRRPENNVHWLAPFKIFLKIRKKGGCACLWSVRFIVRIYITYMFMLIRATLIFTSDTLFNSLYPFIHLSMVYSLVYPSINQLDKIVINPYPLSYSSFHFALYSPPCTLMQVIHLSTLDFTEPLILSGNHRSRYP